MSNYSAAERETNMNCTDEDKKFKIYTLQQAMIGKMKRAGIAPYRVDADGSHFYEVDFNQVSIRSKRKGNSKRTMSEEHKAKLQAGRKNKS